MLNEQVMMDTVLRLVDAGIDDPTVISTLVDAGLTNEEAILVIKKVKDKSASSQAPAPDIGPATSQEVRLLKTQLETQADVHDLHQTTTSNILDDHEERIADIDDQIQEVKEKVSQGPAVDPSINYRLSEIETKLAEVNAQTKAALDVLQKILDNNRKILTDLEAQK